MIADPAHQRSLRQVAERATARRCPCSGCPGPQPGDTAPDWHSRTGPGPLLHARMLASERTGRGHDELRLPSWVDHVYRLRLPDGRWQYVAEPYELAEEAFADLAALEAAGFDVSVTATDACHYPGHTVAVRITGVAP